MNFLKDKFATDFTAATTGATVKELGKEIGISASTVSRLNNGMVPDIETFGRACTWMNKSPSDYFAEPNDDLKTLLKDIVAAGAQIWGGAYAGSLIDRINKL